ncbi:MULTISPECIES: isochorismatase family protein [Azospirillum]|nr:MULTISPECIES: isochorismatase family protein [Azospirillum]ALJ38931.1 N-carbamoylsarcosine amidase [Azospirillum brasilense]MDW7557365.1 isochorismatase family protein [Azospirillum brasilense]MDW7597034.1 isochorismatase family protein [Azospirillum brasilense]MDW7632149.1 isochorismatase family protein [Azospirillum brasilense]MDX5950672.1 isochorismatase family protein [Azospirillum brasilense]
MSVAEQAVYERQGFGRSLGIQGRIGLLIVDFVNGFADPAVFGGGNIAPAIARTAQVLEKARAMGWAVAHSRIVYADDGSDGNVFSIKVPGMQTLTEHAPISAIVPELTPVPGELVVRKTVPSAFFGTGLAPWLTQRGVETLLIAGATTSGCVRASVVDAMCHGFRPVVMADCVGDRALAPHEANLFDIGQKYGDVVPAERVLAL